ncbi:MAG: apurinic endonuclease Apn1 [Phycisphaerales bacterium]|nr:apurinic endonuclease Apn1 [Phycisphaerales bacterium]
MFGSHLSVSGGYHKALAAAESLGLDTVQIFTQAPAQWNLKPVVQPVVVQNDIKNQQQWAAPPLVDENVAKWKAECDRLKFAHTVSHDSYLINLASQDAALWAKSIDAFAEELRRCVVLGIPYLVTHPGAHLGSGEDVGLARVAEALDEVHGRLPAGESGPGGGPATITCLEITAGQGTSLGYKLEHLATIIEKVKAPERLAVCLDTAHLFAAGYDFRGKKYAAFRKQIVATVGLDRVRVLHLNDSKKDLGSRVDRHDHIGRGTIGLDGFRPIVRDEAFANVPKILETAKGKDEQGREWDAVNVEVLKGLM